MRGDTPLVSILLAQRLPSRTHYRAAPADPQKSGALLGGKPPAAVTRNRWDRIRKLHAAGWTDVAMAAELKIAARAVGKARASMGLARNGADRRRKGCAG